VLNDSLDALCTTRKLGGLIGRTCAFVREETAKKPDSFAHFACTPDDIDEQVDDSQGREQDLFGGRCGTRTHDLSRVNPSWVVSVTWGSYGKSSSEGK
jgi:hypothetical protein